MNYISKLKRDQIMIKALDEYIDEESEVIIIDKVIEAMDLESLGFEMGKNYDSSRPKYDPKDLLKLCIYGYSNGIRSSRKLAKQAIINKEVIWLIKGIKPKYRVIADFRKTNINSLKSFFKSYVDFCIQLGLYGQELIAIDGSKFEADASKRKHYSKNKLDKMKNIAQEKINGYLHDIEANDKLEECEETKVKKKNLKKAIQTVEEKIKEYMLLEKKLEEMGVNEINFTDSDARTVKFGAHQGTDVGYNVQTAVDSQNKMVATFEVINNSADQGQLFSVGTKAKEALETDELEILADKGYYDVADFEKCENNNLSCYVSKPSYTNSTGNPLYFSDKFKYDIERDIFICPENQELHCITKRKNTEKITYANVEACSKCPNREKRTTLQRGRILYKNRNHVYSEIVDTRTKANKSKSMKRQGIVEHVFGIVKRTMGFTYFLLRCFKKIMVEMSIIYFCYNLKRSISVLGHDKI